MQEVSEKNTLVQLKEIAKKLNIKGIAALKKSELVDRINSYIAEEYKNAVKTESNEVLAQMPKKTENEKDFEKIAKSEICDNHFLEQNKERIQKAIENKEVPPTIGYQVPDPECDLDIVPNEVRKAELNIVMSNSLGFGGHNACIVMKKM